MEKMIGNKFYYLFQENLIIRPYNYQNKKFNSKNKCFNKSAISTALRN